MQKQKEFFSLYTFKYILAYAKGFYFRNKKTNLNYVAALQEQKSVYNFMFIYHFFLCRINRKKSTLDDIEGKNFQ